MKFGTRNLENTTESTYIHNDYFIRWIMDQKHSTNTTPHVTLMLRQSPKVRLIHSKKKNKAIIPSRPVIGTSKHLKHKKNKNNEATVPVTRHNNYCETTVVAKAHSNFFFLTNIDRHLTAILYRVCLDRNSLFTLILKTSKLIYCLYASWHNSDLCNIYFKNCLLPYIT